MKRKVIKQGNNTLTITLPRKWTEQYGVKPGDEVHIEEFQKGLMLNVDRIVTKGEIEVVTPPRERFTMRLILGPYIHGYDTIRVRFNDRESYNKIENFSNCLLGFEIVEHKDNTCVIKNIAKGMDEEFDTVANRLFLLTISTGHELLEAIKKENISFFQEIEHIERNATKLDLFCRRMINTKNYKGERSATSIYRIICAMEEITDIYRDIARFLMMNRTKPDKEALIFFQEVIGTIEDFYKIYNKYKPEEAMDFRLKEVRLSKKGIESMKGLKEGNAVLMHYLSSIMEKLHHASEELG